jgi:hypothetical protein
MDIGSVLGSAASGGVLGGIFSLGGAAVEYVSNRAAAKEGLEAKKVDYAHELQIKEKDSVRSRQDAQELHALETLKASFEGLQKSIDDQTVLSGKVDGPVLDILALFRPGLTIMLVLMVLVFGIMKLETYFLQAVELVSMAVAWWFGDRQRNRALNQ